jgi:hypothetical protein
VFRLFRHGDDIPRPPLAGRLVGLAVGVCLLALGLYFFIDVVQTVVALFMPFIALIIIYRIILGKLR